MRFREAEQAIFPDREQVAAIGPVVAAATATPSVRVLRSEVVLRNTRSGFLSSPPAVDQFDSLDTTISRRDGTELIAIVIIKTDTNSFALSVSP